MGEETGNGENSRPRGAGCRPAVNPRKLRYVANNSLSLSLFQLCLQVKQENFMDGVYLGHNKGQL